MWEEEGEEEKEREEEGERARAIKVRRNLWYSQNKYPTTF